MFSLLVSIIAFLIKLILFFVALIIAVPLIFLLSLGLVFITGYLMVVVTEPILKWIDDKEQEGRDEVDKVFGGPLED